MSHIKVAFFDIDGTLIDHQLDKKLSMIERTPKSTKVALQQLSQNGITPIIATGRGRAYIVDYAAELGCSSYVSSNGSNITFEGETLFQSFLTKEQILAITSELENRQLSYAYETIDKRIFIPRKGETIEILNKDIIIGEKEAYLNHNIMQIIVNPENVRTFELTGIAGVQAKVVAPTVINILPETISKGTAIKILLEKLNINKSETIAFGDEENDLEMFEVVGSGVAMGNAIAALKEKATYVTKPVDEDGIFHACKKLGLL